MKPKLNTNQPAKDLCYTPAYATQALCEFLGETNNLGEMFVREPAYGEGHMSLILMDYFQWVWLSDINKGSEIDFLDDNDVVNINLRNTNHCIITNPPSLSQL